jgi:uncharacterized cupredoxin-like copper-binding protein
MGLAISAGLLAAALPALVSADGEIGVELTEAPPSVTASSNTTAAGATTFEVANVGAIAHEFVVIRTDLAADALPVTGNAVDLSALDVIADSDEFAAGTGGTVTADLLEGSYVLICNVPGHYGLGMRTALTVSGTATDGAPVPAAAGNAGLAANGSTTLTMLGLGAAALFILGGAGILVRRQANSD